MDDKRKQIIKETASLYFKYGIRSITMDDIAKSLGISKKTLYQYFNDKTNLVDTIVEYMGNNSELHHCGESENLNAIEKHYFIYKKLSSMLNSNNDSFEYDLRKYYPNQYKKMILYRREIMYEKMKNDILKGISEGFFRKDMNIEKVVILNMISIESMKDNDLLKKYNYKLIDVLDEFFKYHLYAIGTKKGINEYKKLINNDSEK